MLRIALAALAAATLAACSPPKPPEEERRPEPQAAAGPAPAIAQAADAYKDRARDAVKATQEAAKDETARIDAAPR